MLQNILARVYFAFYSFLQQPYKVVGVITLFGALMRLFHLGYKSLWLDEAVVYWVAHGSFKEVIAQNATDHSAPPLFPFLLNLVLGIGESEVMLRAIPSLAGIATIPAIYLLASQFLSRYSAYFCAFIVAISSSQVMYSQQLREYSMTFLLAILMLHFFYQQLHKPTWKNWTFLTLTLVLGLFVQYGLALFILALNLIFVIELSMKANRKTQLVKWTTAQFLVLCAVVAVYQLSLKYHKQQIVPGGLGAAPGYNYLVQAYWDGSLLSLTRLAIGNTLRIFAFAYPDHGSSLFFFTFCIGLLAALRERNGRTALMMFAVPMVVTFAAAWARLYPYHGDRHDIFLTPMIYVLAGFGFSYLSNLDKKQIVRVTLVLVVGLSGLRSTYGYLMDPGPENIKPPVTILSSSFKPEDRIYIYYGAIPAFRYYYRSNVDRWIYGVSSRGQPDRYLQQLDEVLSQPGRLWMIFSHCYTDECKFISMYASKLREVKLVAQENEAWLYLAR
ncbi:MAG: glycosyltransferase family 39 protein [Candidatus Tectomicrobia bacterium]|nr:glycosyltransferase family 39 protein [Candidatus Tectomicrobia bacterium]